MQPTTRKSHIDILRIIAAFFVVYIHTSAYSIFETTTGFRASFYIAISVIAKTSVPIFFMISGALLLNKEETIGTILKKRFSRIAIVLFLFCIALYVITLPDGTSFSLLSFLRSFCSETVPHAFPYWFLYAYLGLILMLPYLRRIVKEMTQTDFIYILILHFLISTLLPIVNYILITKGFAELQIAPHFSIPIAIENILFYPIMGYWLEHKWDNNKMHMPLILTLIGVILISIATSCLLTIGYKQHLGNSTHKYLVIFDYLLAFCVYILSKKISAKIPCKASKIISFCAQLTLGIYLFDPVWKRVFYNDFYYAVADKLTIVKISLIWCIISVVISSIVTYILKKIPYIKKLF